MHLILYFEFFKIGIFSIGGGLATLPFLYQLSDRYGWFTYVELADMVAVSEATPGAIGVNMATYAGYSVSGLSGAVVATLGLVSPSIIIIIILSHFFMRFKESAWVKAVFYGLRPASTALIAAAGFSFMVYDLIDVSNVATSIPIVDIVNIKGFVFAILLFIIMNNKRFKQVHPVFFIVFSSVVGIVFSF